MVLMLNDKFIYDHTWKKKVNISCLTFSPQYFLRIQNSCKCVVTLPRVLKHLTINLYSFNFKCFLY